MTCPDAIPHKFVVVVLSRRTSNSTASNFGSRSILENETEHMLVDYGLPVPVVVTESLALKSGMETDSTYLTNYSLGKLLLKLECPLNYY